MKKLNGAQAPRYPGYSMLRERSVFATVSNKLLMTSVSEGIVLATGGGAVLRNANRQRLAQRVSSCIYIVR